MKTFVLIAGMWFNVDHIMAFEDSYRERAFKDPVPYCHVSMVNGWGFKVENESCADIVRDVTTQMEDPN